MKERIKEVRKSLGMTLDKFGGKLGVGKSAISRIENGVNSPSEQIIKSICREFDVSEEWLRTGKGNMFVVRDPEEELMSWAGKALSGKGGDFQKAFVKVLSRLSPEAWAMLERKILEFSEELKNIENEEKD